MIPRDLQVQASQSPTRFRDLWKSVAPLMRAVDVMYANLEGPMAPRLLRPETLKGTLHFRNNIGLKDSLDPP